MSPSKQNQERPLRLGYIGLGIMGSAMAANLLKAGHALKVWNRTPEKMQPLVEAGAVACDSPAHLAGQCDVVFLNLTDTPDVEHVLFSLMGVGPGANERTGVIVVDHSTISPVATRQFVERLEPYGGTLLDAPVSGGDTGAKAGTLSIMVGGDAAAFEVVRPLLDVVGGTVTHLGPAGSGQACKACNQVAVLGALLGTCEAIALAERLDLDPHAMLEVVGQGAGGSWQLQNLGPKIVEGDFTPGFFVDYLLKDLRIVADAAQQTGQTLPVTDAARSLLQAASELGHGRDGTQAVMQAVRALHDPEAPQTPRAEPEQTFRAS